MSHKKNLEKLKQLTIEVGMYMHDEDYIEKLYQIKNEISAKIETIKALCVDPLVTCEIVKEKLDELTHKKYDLVYLIDDDIIFTKLTARLLDLGNIAGKLMIFNNGNEALSEIKYKIANNLKLPDMILLDINMPLMSGWDFLEKLSSIIDTEKLHISMVSSSTNKDDIERAEKYNVSKILTKPFNITDL